jgi:hypothetical protein
MGGYTEAVFGQRLGKHVPEEKHESNKRAVVFHVVRAMSAGSYVREPVKRALQPEAEE